MKKSRLGHPIGRVRPEPAAAGSTKATVTTNARRPTQFSPTVYRSDCRAGDQAGFRSRPRLTSKAAIGKPGDRAARS